MNDELKDLMRQRAELDRRIKAIQDEEKVVGALRIRQDGEGLYRVSIHFTHRIRHEWQSFFQRKTPEEAINILKTFAADIEESCAILEGYKGAE